VFTAARIKFRDLALSRDRRVSHRGSERSLHNRCFRHDLLPLFVDRREDWLGQFGTPASSPDGSLMSRQTLCDSWYSFHPDPARYRERRILTGRGLVFLTISNVRQAVRRDGCKFFGNSLKSAVTRWIRNFAKTLKPERGNLVHAPRPCTESGPAGITSKAEMRSVTTKSSVSPRSKTSRTCRCAVFDSGQID